MKERNKSDSIVNFFKNITTKQAIWIIIVVGFIVFFNSFSNSFVEDDLSYIINNPSIQTINIINSFKSSLFNTVGQYRPVPALYFSILYTFFKTTPLFYHITQLSLHITCGIVIYLLFRNFFSTTFAIILALIFLVHPINVESVSYIAQSINPLFFLLGCYPLLMVTKRNLSIREVIIISLLLLTSIFTKETGILFLLLLILYVFLFQKNRKNLIALSVSGTLILVTYFFTRFFIGNVFFSTRTLVPIADQSLVVRLMNIPSIIYFYLKTFLFPITLVVDQHWVITEISFHDCYYPLIIDLVFFLGIFFLGKHLIKVNKKLFKNYLFFLSWFMLGLSLHIQIFPLDKTVADRWFYFPIVGLLGLIGILIKSLKLKIDNCKTALILLGLLIILLLSARSIVRNTNWKDPITLYSHDIKYNDNFDIENGLGVAYGRDDNYSKAIEHFKKSIEMRPYEYNLMNLATIYAEIGDIENAKEYFEKSLGSKNYNLYQSHNYSFKLYKNYVTLLLFYENDIVSSIEILEDAIDDYPDSSLFWSYLAISYYKQNNTNKALYAANEAYKLDPSEVNEYIYTKIGTNDDLNISIEDFKGGLIEVKVDSGD